MIVKTFKVRKKGLVICGGILIALLVILVVFGVVHKAVAKNYSMETEDDRQKFMSEMGWKVSEEYTSCKVVSIPEDFNDTYESYNELQKDQGFNLKKYKGEMVEIYTYEVYNYPGKSENVVINLMVFEGKLIGGDVSCNELDGFMQGLKNPNADDSSYDEKSENENSDDEDSKKSDSSESKNKSNKKNKKSNAKADDESSKSDKEDSKNTFDSNNAEEESKTNVSDGSEKTTESTTEASTEVTSSSTESENQ